ncbi:MAG: potassium channel family protein [Oligoflexus sp.]
MVKKQIIVIGLGQFGMGLIRALSNKNADVIAVDIDQQKIQAASPHVSQAICFDATNEDTIAQLNPASRDVCICATGDQSKEAAIICTALLKQMGAKRVIARANDELHSRILKLVGADEVINPEWAFGERFANRVMHEDILEEMSLGKDLVVTEFKVPENFVNRSLVDLELRKRFGITVVAIRSAESGNVQLAQPNEILRSGDILIVVSMTGNVSRLLNT